MWRLYGWLLRLYPASFRERYRDAMVMQFRDEHRQCRTRRERAGLWWREAADVAVSAPAEFAREFGQDVRHACKLYRGRSAGAVLAVGALALSIGASTGVFSILNALLLRALPFRAPGQLVRLEGSPVTAVSGRAAFQEWSGRNAYLQSAAAYSAAEMNVAVRGRAVRARVAETSGNFLELLGVAPVVGRGFTAADEALTVPRGAVISHALWHQLFGGDPAVAGAPFRLNGAAFVVAGVAPPRFDYPGGADIWMPTVFDFEVVPKRGASFYETIGRLKPGITIREARARFAVEVRRHDPKAGAEARMTSLRDELAGPVGTASWVLAGMTALVLLMACANLAHLLLSRIAGRRPEFALRAALGASRGRLTQQLTTEALCLTGAGMALGLLVAWWACRLASTVAPPRISAQAYSILDWRVLGFALTLALITGLAFGVMPARLLARGQPADSLMRVQPGLRMTGSRRMRSALLFAQGCLTLALLVASLAMSRKFLELLQVDLGFRTREAVTMTVSLEGSGQRPGAGEWRYYNEVLQRLRAAPGVEAAGGVGYVPLGQHAYMALSFRLDSGQTIPRVVTNAATPGYFDAIGIRFLAGGDFPAIRRQTEPVVIVNEAFARETQLGTAVVGRRVLADWSKTPYSIAGVVETSRANGPEYGAAPMIYWPVEEEPGPHLTFVARVTGDPEAQLARCRDIVKAVDPRVPVYDVKTLERRLSDMLARPRFFTTATLSFAVLVWFLAIVGSFGAAAHSVSQRTHEMGVRLALGAPYGRLRSMIMSESAMPVALGAVAGIGIAAAAVRYLNHLVAGVGSVEMWIYAAAAAMLLMAACAAGWMATARILAIHPADAVRAP